MRGSGTTLGEAFEQAALALTAVVAEPEEITPATALDIESDAPDLELLLALRAATSSVRTRPA